MRGRSMSASASRSGWRVPSEKPRTGLPVGRIKPDELGRPIDVVVRGHLPDGRYELKVASGRDVGHESRVLGDKSELGWDRARGLQAENSDGPGRGTGQAGKQLQGG